MANKYKVLISKRAYLQIEEIFDFIKYSLCAPDSATNLISHFNIKINSLSSFPKRNAVVFEARGIMLRRIIVDNFYIYYSVKEDKKEVLVMMVLFNKRDQAAQLKYIY